VPITAVPSSTWRLTVRQRRPALGALLVLALLLAGCNGGEGEEPADEAPETTADTAAGEPPEEPVTIRLGHWGATAEILYVMAHQPEVAPNQGTWYEVELSRVDPPAIPRDVASGALEGGAMAALDAAAALDQEAEIVLAGAFVEDREGWGSLTWLVHNDSGVGSVADLRGQTLGTPGAGGSTEVIQEYWLREEGGLEPGDYDTVQIPFPQMADALRTGQIAAGPMPPPFLGQALASGEFRPLFRLIDIRPRLASVLFGLSGEFVAEHPAVAEAFMADWVTVAQWIADPANRAQVLEANNAATEIPVEVLDRYLLTEQDGYRPPNGALDLEGLQETWDFYHEEGAFSTSLNVGDYVNEDLLPPQG
jgi:ABC-type nitrate/sulfonate/bicarbonate transport system substrate-binding protein